MNRNFVMNLMQDEDLLFYLRHRPMWIKHLTRYPHEEALFIQQYKVETKKTFGDRMEQVGQYASLASMFLMQ